ncbi:hypothetical protein JXB11_03555 [Candidatus Woesearchaeota archaeon]|nr:hypothetical protein [Candidatus Woesearchaeota archaeon]
MNKFTLLFLILAAFLIFVTYTSDYVPPESATQESPGELYSSQASYTADYESTGGSGASTTRHFVDSPKFAIEITSQDSLTKSVYDGESFFMCINSGAGWNCYEMPPSMASPPDIRASVAGGKLTAEYIGACSAAGESGKKFRLTNALGDETISCYTDDGILLQTEGRGASMKATSIARAVPADAFTLPAQP